MCGLKSGKKCNFGRPYYDVSTLYFCTDYELFCYITVIYEMGNIPKTAVASSCYFLCQVSVLLWGHEK